MWPNYSLACRQEVDKLLKRGGSLSAYQANKSVGLGPKKGSEVYAFERQIEREFRVKHSIAVNSGTAAIYCALAALDVKEKEVITSPYTFSATASAIIHAGGVPRFADVDPDTFCITPETVRPHITKRTAAIMPVHLFGYFADLTGFEKLEVPIIEDACQAVGASRNGVFSGTVGTAGAYSFNGGKNIPAGEGGALITDDDKIAEKARELTNHSENFDTSHVGFNYRMHEAVACIARHGLLALDERNRRRRDLAYAFHEGLGDLRGETCIQASWYRCHRQHVFYVTPFVLKHSKRKISSEDRDRFIKRCKSSNLTIGEGYICPPLHHYNAFRQYSTLPLPVVDELSERTLCLIYDFTPDKPLSYAREVAKIVAGALA